MIDVSKLIRPTDFVESLVERIPSYGLLLVLLCITTWRTMQSYTFSSGFIPSRRTPIQTSIVPVSCFFFHIHNTKLCTSSSFSANQAEPPKCTCCSPSIIKKHHDRNHGSLDQFLTVISCIADDFCIFFQEIINYVQIVVFEKSSLEPKNPHMFFQNHIFLFSPS